MADRLAHCVTLPTVVVLTCASANLQPTHCSILPFNVEAWFYVARVYALCLGIRARRMHGHRGGHGRTPVVELKLMIILVLYISKTSVKLLVYIHEAAGYDTLNTDRSTAKRSCDGSTCGTAWRRRRRGQLYS